MSAAYDAMHDGCAVVLRTDRSFIRVHGRDPARMVQGLITNDVARADERHAVYAALLTPKGRMIADVRVLRRGEDLLLETHADAHEPLTAHLRKFVPPLFARFDDVTHATSLLSVHGPLSARLLSQVTGASIADDAVENDVQESAVDGAPVTLVATSYGTVRGHDLILPVESVSAVRDTLERAGARAATLADLEVVRIEAGRPRWGAELDDTTIPLEAGLRASAISETKGCYTGQEVIIRILHRGHVNWLLRGVLLGDVPPPPRDAPLLNPEGRKVGRITSSVRSPALGQTIALAYVRRELDLPVSLVLEEAGGRTVTAVELPFADTVR